MNAFPLQLRFCTPRLRDVSKDDVCFIDIVCQSRTTITQGIFSFMLLIDRKVCRKDINRGQAPEIELKNWMMPIVVNGGNSGLAVIHIVSSFDIHQSLAELPQDHSQHENPSH